MKWWFVRTCFTRNVLITGRSTVLYFSSQDRHTKKQKTSFSEQPKKNKRERDTRNNSRWQPPGREQSCWQSRPGPHRWRLMEGPGNHVTYHATAPLSVSVQLFIVHLVQLCSWYKCLPQSVTNSRTVFYPQQPGVCLIVRRTSLNISKDYINTETNYP